MDDYPLVGVDPDARVPPRSVLAALRPMGLGTPYRESLSSYYLALAHMHHLSPMILAREVIVPRIKIGNIPRDKENFTIWKLPRFNGIGAVPEAWAKHLCELTGRKDLINLTLVPLRPYTSTQRLMNSTKRWCPLCFNEAVREGRAYGQLLWEIAAVEACPKHGTKLLSQCGCKGTASLLRGKALQLSWICESCGCSLAQNSEELIESASEAEIKRAQLVGDLLVDIEKLKSASDKTANSIPVFLERAVHHFARGNAALFGKLLGIKKNTLHGWMHGEFLPTFFQIVEIALACKCSITDVLLNLKITFKETELLKVKATSRKPFRTKATYALNKDLVMRQLEMLLNENPPVSVVAAAARIGLNRRTLYSDFGDIAQKVSKRFQEYKRSEDMRNFENRCDSYRQSAIRLMKKGIKPTPELVGLDIRGKRVIIKGQERAECSRICREVIQRRQRV